MVSKKNVVLSSLILIFCAVSIVVFLVFRGDFHNVIDTLLNQQSNKISRVFMRQGMTGNSVNTKNKMKIQELIQLVNNRQYTKSKDQEPRGGYTFFYDFYEGNTKVLRITGSGSNVDINGIYYNVDKPISTDALEKWFDSLPITKWPKSAK